MNISQFEVDYQSKNEIHKLTQYDLELGCERGLYRSYMNGENLLKNMTFNIQALCFGEVQKVKSQYIPDSTISLNVKKDLEDYEGFNIAGKILEVFESEYRNYNAVVIEIYCTHFRNEIKKAKLKQADEIMNIDKK